MGASMMQPLFMADVPVEYVSPIIGGMTLGLTALWKRANVLQDRQQAQDAANLALMVDLVERVVASLDKNTVAIREMLDAR